MSLSPASSRAIIWDFGGVLIDWNSRHLYRKMFENEHLMEQFLAESGFSEWNIGLDRGQPFAEAIAEHSARFPRYAPYLRAYDERWIETLNGEIAPSVALLAAVRAAGYPQYGLTNWSAVKFEIARVQYPFMDWFESIIVSGQVQLVKPDPRIYALLLERIGRQAHECLFIDDSIANINAASSLGFQTVRFESPAQLRDELYRLDLIAPESAH